MKRALNLKAVLRTAGGIALAVVIGVGMTACYISSAPLPGTPPPSQPPAKGLPEVELTGEDIVIKKVGSGTSTVDKNTWAVDNAPASSVGFLYEFPEEVIGKGYYKIGVEVELISVTTPDFIAFNAKDSNQIDNDVLIFGHTQQYHGELKIGTIVDKALDAACSSDCLKYTAGTCIVGAKGYAEYPLSKLPNDLIAFQFNPYAGDITTPGWSSSSNATCKIAVTKIVFIPVEGELEMCEYEDECDCAPCPGEDCECKKPFEFSAADIAAFNAVAGLTTITQEWGNTGCIVFDSLTGVLSRSAGSSSLFSVPTTGLTILETNTIKVTWAALAKDQVKLTAKKPGTSSDLASATYVDVTTAGATGFLQGSFTIPAARYTDTNGDFEAPAKLSFQDNSGTDAEWKLKIVSVTVE